MNLVMDLIFCDSLAFSLSETDYADLIPLPSLEEIGQRGCEKVGIELKDYDRLSIMLVAGRRHFLFVGARWIRSKQ